MEAPQIAGGVTVETGPDGRLELLGYASGDIRLALTARTKEDEAVQVFFLLPAHNVAEFAAQCARVFALTLRAGAAFEEGCK